MSVLRLLTLSAGLAIAAAPAFAQDISGNWSGFGKAKLSSTGKTESFRCRVAYRREATKVFGIKAICANPTVKIIQIGKVLNVRKNTYVGELHNPDYDIRGRVRVVVAGAKQTVTVSASEGSGVLNLSRR